MEELKNQLQNVEKFVPENLLDKIKLGMTEIQIKSFVLNEKDFPTPFSKFKQAKVELWSRYENVVNMLFDIEKTKANIEMKEALIEDLDNSKINQAKSKLYQIDIKRKEFQLKVSHKTVSEKLSEMKHFLDVYNELKGFEGMDENEVLRQEMETWIKRAKLEPKLNERHGDAIRKMEEQKK